MPHIRHLVVLKASPDAVYRAVSTRDGMAAWWTTEVNAKPGEEDKLRLHFGPDYFKELHRGPSTPGVSCSWTCVAADPQWVGTDIVFRIASEGGVTKLFFEHNGWKDYTDLYSQCSYDWTLFLRSLKSYLEVGKGKPFPDYQ